MSALKVWADHEDFILSTLCRKLLGRDLFRTAMRNDCFDSEEIKHIRSRVKDRFGVDDTEVDYFVYTQIIRNSAYDAERDPIRILNNKGELVDIAEASDLSNLEALARSVEKHTVTYPKEIGVI
ncbi:hypothetical protein G5B35_18785 [Parapusillimonas sp. SGNA-6]|nr:hypothetical protein [Parapusillimonas sp. SGNA-6]